MTAISNYMEEKIVESFLKNIAYTPPTTVYVALFSTSANLEYNEITDEISGGAYARQEITFGNIDQGTDRVSNTNEITFANATANWTTIRGAGVMDASTSGNVLLWTSVAPKSINDTEQLVIQTGKLVFELK